jgi:hypothetical protein
MRIDVYSCSQPQIVKLGSKERVEVRERGAIAAALLMTNVGSWVVAEPVAAASGKNKAPWLTES